MLGSWEQPRIETRRGWFLLPSFTVAQRICSLLAVLFFALLSVGQSWALEPIKITRDDIALDLSNSVEIYRGQGDTFQVSTAPGSDNIVRRIEVEAQEIGRASCRERAERAVRAVARKRDKEGES